MAHFEIRDLTFSYASSKGKHSLEHINLSVAQGEFLVLCGASGSGKSTLLRHLKTVLTPSGKSGGQVLFHGVPLKEVPDRDQAGKIGFVMQNPDDQIVTDKVWHELAFGLESLGCDQKTMRSRVAEMACYFGIQDWFHRDVATLSGGQKQRLCIARALIGKAKILIFDDSTSAVDTATEKKIREALAARKNVTKIIIAQRVTSVMNTDQIIILDDGKVHRIGTHAELLADDPIYQEIYASQMKGGDENGSESL